MCVGAHRVRLVIDSVYDLPEADNSLSAIFMKKGETIGTFRAFQLPFRVAVLNLHCPWINIFDPRTSTIATPNVRPVVFDSNDAVSDNLLGCFTVTDDDGTLFNIQNLLECSRRRRTDIHRCDKRLSSGRTRVISIHTRRCEQQCHHANDGQNGKNNMLHVDLLSVMKQSATPCR